MPLTFREYFYLLLVLIGGLSFWVICVNDGLLADICSGLTVLAAFGIVGLLHGFLGQDITDAEDMT